MDAAKQKRILKLLAGREADRDQALELLIALGDDDLWRAALAEVRTTVVVGRRQVGLRDLPMLAAAPDHLPEVVALRGETRSMWCSTEVPEAIGCLTGLEALTVMVESGGSEPRVEPSLSHARGLPLRSLELFGADLGDGAVLQDLPLQVLELKNCRFSSLPPSSTLQRLEGFVREGVTELGGPFPALRRLALGAPGLASLAAVADAVGLEELVLEDAGALTGLAGLRVDRLREVVLEGAERVRDLAPLRGAARLERLVVADAPIEDLSPLAGAAALTSLAVRGARALADLSPLAGLGALRALDLRGCASLRDLGPLTGLAGLRVLALADTGLAPQDVPAVLRPYATFAEEPKLELLAARPRHPDDPRGEA